MEVPIVGRSPELGQLRAALVAASGGAGRLVLVSGEPGIGKTRLVAAVAEMAGEYGVPAAAGFAIDDPGMPPLWPWSVVSQSVPGLAGVLGGASGVFDESLGGAGDSESARFVMFAAACRALADAAAERGLLVVLEDLQWADRTSLLLLRHLAGELARSRLLVVATFRESADTPLAGLLPALLRAGDARPIRLTGLSRPDIAQWLRLVKADGDVDALADRLRAGTGGNPLFVRMLVERGPSALGEGFREFPELRQLVLAHLSGLGEPARSLLGAASVLGERIDPPVLAEVTGLSAATVAGVLDSAVAAGVLAAAPDGTGLSFAHALVRDAVYDELSPSRRAALHERAARALERSGRGAACAGQIAGHWERCGAPGWAAHCVRWASEAARSATASLAYDEAARFAELALHAAEADIASADGLRIELTLEAARAEFVAGHIEVSLRHCQSAARLAEDAGAPGHPRGGRAGDHRGGRPGHDRCRRGVVRQGDPCRAGRGFRAARPAARPAGDHRRGKRARGTGRASCPPKPSRSPSSATTPTRCSTASTRGTCRCARPSSWPNDASSRPARARSPTRPASRWPNCGATYGWSTRRSRREISLAVDDELGRIEQFAVYRRHGLAGWHLHRLGEPGRWSASWAPRWSTMRPPARSRQRSARSARSACTTRSSMSSRCCAAPSLPR